MIHRHLNSRMHSLKLNGCIHWKAWTETKKLVLEIAQLNFERWKVSLKSDLFHFRLTVSNLSFCDLTLDFAYHVEEYSQLDSRRSIIITSIVLVVAMSMLMTDFTRYYTRRGTKRCKGHFRSELYCIAYTIWLILFPMTFMNKTNMILVISPPIRCPTWWLHLLSDQFVP